MVLGLSPPLGHLLNSFSSFSESVNESSKMMEGNNNNDNNENNGDDGYDDINNNNNDNNNNSNNYNNNNNNNTQNTQYNTIKNNHNETITNTLHSSHSTTSLNLFSGNFPAEKNTQKNPQNSGNPSFSKHENNAKSVKLITKSTFCKTEKTKIFPRNNKNVPVRSTYEREIEKCTGNPVLVSKRKSDFLLR